MLRFLRFSKCIDLCIGVPFMCLNFVTLPNLLVLLLPRVGEPPCRGLCCGIRKGSLLSHRDLGLRNASLSTLPWSLISIIVTGSGLFSLFSDSRSSLLSILALLGTLAALDTLLSSPGFSAVFSTPIVSNIFILSRMLGCLLKLSVSSPDSEPIEVTEVLGLGAAEVGGPIWTLTGLGDGLGARLGG